MPQTLPTTSFRSNPKTLAWHAVLAHRRTTLLSHTCGLREGTAVLGSMLIGYIGTRLLLGWGWGDHDRQLLPLHWCLHWCASKLYWLFKCTSSGNHPCSLLASFDMNTVYLFVVDSVAYPFLLGSNIIVFPIWCWCLSRVIYSEIVRFGLWFEAVKKEKEWDEK